MSMNFCKNFAVLRRAHGYTQEAIAEKCGVSRQAIAKWETGASLPDMYKLVDIAKLFDVSIDDLVCGNCFSGLDALPAIMDEMKAIRSKLDKIGEWIPDSGQGEDELYQNYLYMLDYPDEDDLVEWRDILSACVDIKEEFRESGYEKAWDIIIQLITIERGSFVDVLQHIYELMYYLYEEYVPVGDKKNTQYLDFIEDVANIMPAWSKILKHEIMLERQEPNRFWTDWDLYQDIGLALIESYKDD